MLKFIKNISSILLLLILVCNAIYAKNLEVSVNKRQIEFTKTLDLTIKVIENEEEFKLPNINDFVVVFKGKKNSKDNVVIYEYNLAPKEVGFFKIPSISYEGETSKPINIKVYDKTDGISFDNYSLVSAEVDSKISYVNQLVLYKLKFKTKQDLSDSENPTYILPKFQDFWKNKSNLKSGYTLIDGENYFTFEVTTPLYPMRSGTIEIDPSEISIKYLGSRNTTKFKTKIVNIKVLPLPEIEKPDNFSGAVGRYYISANVNKNKVKVRELFVLNIDIKGNGNINSVFEPQIELPSDMNKYSTNIELNTDEIISLKRFKVNIIPLIEGKTSIPKIYFSYFDTDRNNYVTINTEPINMEIVGDDENIVYEKQDSNTEEIIGSKETENIKLKENIDLKQYNKQLIKNKTLIICFIIMLLCIFISLIYRLKIFYYYMDPERVKKDEAKKMFNKYVEQAEKFKSDKFKFIYYIDLSLKMLLRTKVNYKYNTIAKTEIKELLYSINMKEPLINEIIKFITKIEKYKFKDIDANLINVIEIKQELFNLKKKMDKKS